MQLLRGNPLEGTSRWEVRSNVTRSWDSLSLTKTLLRIEHYRSELRVRTWCLAECREHMVTSHANTRPFISRKHPDPFAHVEYGTLGLLPKNTSCAKRTGHFVS